MSTLRTADAANRSQRTLIQGGIVVALMALATAVLDWLNAGDFSWRTLGISAVTAVLTAVIAYVHRTVLDPSRIPSALPPSDPGRPADPESGHVDLAVVLLVGILVLLVLLAAGVIGR